MHSQLVQDLYFLFSLSTGSVGSGVRNDRHNEYKSEEESLSRFYHLHM
jgi:hypothetical protein